jgi:hypothetical protein
MKIILICLVLLSASQSTDKPYELKDEAPGMALKQFRANHKRAECSRLTPRRTRCRIYDGVSFAGVIATSFKGCALPECDAQGITANFFDERLIDLSYGVAPFSSAEIISSLKQKFGEPTESNKPSATWRNSVGYLSVSEITLPGSNGVAKPIATIIESALNDKGGSKDTLELGASKFYYAASAK